MRPGFLAAYARAAGLCLRRPGLLGAALLVELPLLLALLAGPLIVLQGWPQWTPHEQNEALRALAVVVLALGALLAAGEAGLLWQADQVLRGEGRGRHGPRQLARPTAGLLLLPAGLWAGRVVCGVLGLALLLVLLCGGDAATFGELVGGRGLSAVWAAWAVQGVPWVIGMGLLLVLCQAVRELLRLGGVFCRAALATGDGSALAGLVAAIRFGTGCGWGLLGRSLLRSVVTLTGASLALWAWALASAAGAWALGAVLAVTLWVLLRAWLRLGDLVYYRSWGGPDRDPLLATPAVRGRRPRRPSGITAGRLQVASEPAATAGCWQPRGSAAEPFANAP